MNRQQHVLANAGLVINYSAKTIFGSQLYELVSTESSYYMRRARREDNGVVTLALRKRLSRSHFAEKHDEETLSVSRLA